MREVKKCTCGEGLGGIRFHKDPRWYISPVWPAFVQMMDVVCGVDESGVGSIVGPLVFAGVAVPLEHEEEMRGWGIRDSKMLDDKSEIDLYKKIVGTEWLIRRTSMASPRELDMAASNGRKARRRRVEKGGIRRLEIDRVAGIATSLMAACALRGGRVRTIYVDSFDSVPGRLDRDITASIAKMAWGATGTTAAEPPRRPSGPFGACGEQTSHAPGRGAHDEGRIRSGTSDVPDPACGRTAAWSVGDLPKVVSLTGADSTMVSVSAASIIASVIHKHEVAKIHHIMAAGGYRIRQLGVFEADNSGMYKFISDYYDHHKTLPAFVRTRCRPIRRMMRKKKGRQPQAGREREGGGESEGRE